MIELLILSLIQGVTEFIPVSSSSHLILISNYLNFNNQNLSIDVSLHIGSFFAVIFYFKNDIFNFLHNRIWNIPRYFELLSALSIDKCLSLSGSIIKSEDNESSFFI